MLTRVSYALVHFHVPIPVAWELHTLIINSTALVSIDHSLTSTCHKLMLPVCLFLLESSGTLNEGKDDLDSTLETRVHHGSVIQDMAALYSLNCVMVAYCPRALDSSSLQSREIVIPQALRLSQHALHKWSASGTDMASQAHELDSSFEVSRQDH